MTRWMKSVGVALMVALPMSAGADPILKFDDPVMPGGTVSYAGTGGPALGQDILFQSILGLDTPANTGVTLDCVGCLLNFQTGNNTVEGALGGAPWQFAGGGQITIVGSIPTLGIGPGTTLLSGSFSGVGVELVSSVTFGTFSGAASTRSTRSSRPSTAWLNSSSSPRPPSRPLSRRMATVPSRAPSSMPT
jgi:hypothetical protein